MKKYIRHLPWLAAAILAAIPLCILASQDQPAPQAPALTPDQKLAFETASKNLFAAKAKSWQLQAEFQRELSDRAKQLQVQLSAASMAESAAQEALKAACPGELSGVDKDAPECKASETPKTKEKSK